MKKTIIIALSITGLLLTGCASQPISTFHGFDGAVDLNGLISSGEYVQKTENIFVLNDSSNSMTKNYLGQGYQAEPSPTKFSVEKEILNRFNQTIPDINLTSSIRSFGFGNCLGWSFTKLNLDPASYSKSTFGSGIDSLTCASGGSPMSNGLEGSGKDLSATAGNIALLILSDGHELDGYPIASVQALKEQYGERLCVYTVWVGNSEEGSGQNVLSQLANISSCGFATTAENIASPEGMARFVKKVFLKAAPPDCSKLDADADGVNDCIDKCPDTLKGAHVNPFGCWVVDVKFDNDKSIIKHRYYGELDNAVNVINANPNLAIEVQGHTSNTGSAEHNQGLSERRAQAVKDYLIKHAAQKEQAEQNLTAKGYGLTQPTDTNETAEGRANNRRVELKVIQ